MAYPTTLDVFPNQIDHVDTFDAADINNPAQGVMALQTLIGYGSGQPTVNATPLTIAKRDANGDVSFNTVNIANSLQVPKSTATIPLFAIDAANTGSGFTLANAAIAYPFGGPSNNFCGFFMVKETTSDGHTAFVFNAGHTIGMIWESSGGTVFSTVAGTANRINIYTHGSVFCPAIENLRGANRTFNVVGFRLASTS